MAEPEAKRRKFTHGQLLSCLAGLSINNDEKNAVATTLVKVPDDVLSKDSREGLSSYLQKVIEDDTTRSIVVGTLHSRFQDFIPQAPTL